MSGEPEELARDRIQPVESLLIVDDETAQMKALCDTLRDRGYRTTGFASARAALEALQTQKFDLLLTDLMMPEMDGISLLRAARELDGDLIGVMMTGHGTIDTAVEAMKAGALDYIIKPFKLSAILPVISRALTIRRLRMENADLARRVSHRTAELEEVNRELEAFSYSVAHDLRAPLRAVLGFTAILQESHAGQLPEDVRGLLDHVTRNAHRMAELIDGLLRLSRLGRQQLKVESVAMTRLVRDVVDELSKDPGDDPVTIVVNPLPDVMADQILLRQVITNLVSNAIKFTRGRQPARVTIGCEQQEGADVFFVRDNGAGFDMRHAERLFGVFQRLHPSGNFPGTGIGLSIVQRIVHRHGGRVWAQAEVDRGATFYFTFPRT